MMGSVYEMQGEMQMSLDSYHRALALNRAGGDRQGQAIVLNNIGNAYSLLGETALRRGLVAGPHRKLDTRSKY